MDKYEILFQIGEGTYGKVLKALNTHHSTYVAIKKIKNTDTVPQIKQIANREIKILKSLNHPNIVSLEEAIPAVNSIFLVFEFVDENLLEVLHRNSQGLPLPDTKSFVYQTAKALQYCHHHKILHRDLKPENLLVSKTGVLKLCDFGFARILNSEFLTEYVSTRWYRAPELLVGSKYDFAIDIWALGCLTYEMYTGQPLFPGSSDYDTLHLIVKSCGNLPTSLLRAYHSNPSLHPKNVPKTATPLLEKKLSNFHPDFAEFIKACLVMSPEDRLTIDEVLAHSVFDEISQEMTKRSRNKQVSPDRIRGGIEASLSFIRDSEGSRGREGIFKRRYEKLPVIKQVERKANDYSRIFGDLKARAGTKSTLKGGYLDKELRKKKYAMVTNVSNENLYKYSSSNQVSSIRTRTHAEKSVQPEKFLSNDFSKRRISKLDLSNLAKKVNFSGIYYSSSRKCYKVMRELPSRSTRGKWLNELLGDEKDFDGQFWAQELFKDTGSDEEYKSESEKDDKFDEDFFKVESDSDQEEVKVASETVKSSKLPKKIKKVLKKKLKFKKAEGITQKEMLEQAAIVEMYNSHDLTKLLMDEENSKVSLVNRKDRGMICWRYKEGIKLGKRKSSIWHMEPLEMFGRSKPVKRFCGVTGKLARYTDPLTGKSYADKEAFKIIRSQYYAEQETQIQSCIKDLETQLYSYT